MFNNPFQSLSSADMTKLACIVLRELIETRGDGPTCPTARPQPLSYPFSLLYQLGGFAQHHLCG